MPKRIPENERRVALNCLVAPATLAAINLTIGVEGGSQGQVVDRAVALLVYGEGAVTTQPTADPAPQQEIPPPKKHAETVAERKERQRKEHAAALAEADVVARAVGREDIDYDLENTPHRSALNVGHLKPTAKETPRYEVRKEKVRPLLRPHGSTEAKQRRQTEGEGARRGK